MCDDQEKIGMSFFRSSVFGKTQKYRPLGLGAQGSLFFYFSYKNTVQIMYKNIHNLYIKLKY